MAYFGFESKLPYFKTLSKYYSAELEDNKKTGVLAFQTL